MPKFIEGFKNFILRGDAVDLAVGVVIGAAFNNVVNALVKDVLTPFIGAVAKVPDFSSMTYELNGSKFLYGDLINNVISFLLVAFAIYFFVILPMNALNSRFKKPAAPSEKKCPECASNIPMEAKRCAFCAQPV